MCQTNNLSSMMSTVKIMSIIEIVLAVALLLAGIVAASYKVPKWCEEPGVEDYRQCQEDYNQANDFFAAVAIWGTLPGVVPLVFGILGVIGAIRQSKGIIGTCLAFAIVGTILCIVGFFIPYIGAAIVSTVCAVDWDEGDASGHLRDTKEGRDFCDRYGGGLWAVVALNIILAVYQFSLSIVMCCICCASPEVWAQKNGAVAPTAAAVPAYPATSAPAAGIPMQPVDTTGGTWQQTGPGPAGASPQAQIPMAEPVK